MSWRMLLRPMCWMRGHTGVLVRGWRLGYDGVPYSDNTELQCRRCDYVLHL